MKVNDPSLCSSPTGCKITAVIHTLDNSKLRANIPSFSGLAVGLGLGLGLRLGLELVLSAGFGQKAGAVFSKVHTSS